MASSDVRGVDVDLDDCSLIWIELAPGEVGSEQEQHVTVEDRMIARRPADDACHADVVGLVVCETVLAASRVGHGCPQSRRCATLLIVRTCAAGVSIDRDRFTPVENVCDL